MVLTDSDFSVIAAVNNFCRENKIKFVAAEVSGPFAFIFNDFGPTFQVLDKDGDDPVEVMIKNISIAEKGIVTLLPGVKHPYQDGEVILIKSVEGME